MKTKIKPTCGTCKFAKENRPKYINCSNPPEWMTKEKYPATYESNLEKRMNCFGCNGARWEQK